MSLPKVKVNPAKYDAYAKKLKLPNGVWDAEILTMHFNTGNMRVRIINPLTGIMYFGGSAEIKISDIVNEPPFFDGLSIDLTEYRK